VGSACARVPTFFLPFFPWLDVDRPNPRTVALWDRLTSRRTVVALGTVEAHRIAGRMGDTVKFGPRLFLEVQVSEPRGGVQ
jgi:hypothetical protein